MTPVTGVSMPDGQGGWHTWNGVDWVPSEEFDSNPGETSIWVSRYLGGLTTEELSTNTTKTCPHCGKHI